MHDDPIAVLERELVEAARRRAGVPDEWPGSQEPRGPRPAGVRSARRRSSLGAFAAVTLTGLAVVVALGALISLRGHPPARGPAAQNPATHPAPAPAGAANVPGRQQLIDILGVLRRPQTPADLRPPWGPRGLWVPPSWGMADTSLIRRATTTPWGEPVFLIPVRPAPGARSAVESVALDVGSAGDCCATASDVATYGDMMTEGAGRSFAGGSTQTRFAVLVPDAVATVQFAPAHPPDPIAAVHDNVAVVQVNQTCCTGGVPMIWRAADGHVIKRVGGAAAPAAPPKPGPETALSRAAERDPSTPNHVWVTPAVGGPHTNFQVHFEVLLNDADYSYQLSGTRCPGITVNGGDGGGTNDVRGRVWSASVLAVAGQAWCPGTYHLSATIMDLGRHGTLKHPARPFGSATFTVKG